MKLKYLGGNVYGGKYLTVGKEYRVYSKRKKGSELMIYDDLFLNERVSTPLWLYEQEIKECFQKIYN